MSVYNMFLKDGRVLAWGGKREGEYPVISTEVPVEEFFKIFPFCPIPQSDILHIIEGLYDDELTKICEDVVASRSA